MSASLPLAIFFSAPLALLGLALIPLALLAQRASGAARSATPCASPGCRRCAPSSARRPRGAATCPALLALALAALVLALAEPHRTVAVPVERASVVLVTDVSRSMMATDVAPTRLEAARDAATRFLDKVPGAGARRRRRVLRRARRLQAPTTEHDEVARAIIDGLTADGGTATGDALAAALEGINQSRKDGKRPPAAIVLLSDGKTTTGRDPLDVARQAGRLRVPIYTVALGTPGATIPNPTRTRRRCPCRPTPRRSRDRRGVAAARPSRSRTPTSWTRSTSGSARASARATREQEITAAFAGGGLLLLAARGAASLRWAGRLP